MKKKHRQSIPKLFLTIESLAIFAAAAFLYFHSGGNGTTFLILFLLPDVGMIGYLANPRMGSVAYNTTHTYAVPVALTALLLATRTSFANAAPLALIWIAHIGMDRAIGFGLKYPTRFKDTHMQHV